MWLCVGANGPAQVPWLPLHGIQFRRVGGPSMTYSMVARTILRELKL
jgi:hypothetical protein